ncbi:MAG: class I SAM-dependent methyltransferase [Pseudanabaena sp. Salubria-1]|nr:class I SAM-dependent methyltransferase [Pseudanabaena sp. Salubria-1]
MVLAISMLTLLTGYEVVGVDIAPDAISLSERKCSRQVKATFLEANVLDLAG